MTIQSWEQAAGKIHEIKGIEAQIEKVKTAAAVQDFMSAALYNNSEIREGIRSLVLGLLERKQVELEEELAKL